MNEIYGGGSRSKKFMPKHKIKKMIRKMKRSYKEGEKIHDKSNIDHMKEEIEAEKMLERELENLDI